MPLFGAHMSAAGGPHLALQSAASFGMDACQLFTKNNKQWRAPLLSQEVLELFAATWKQLGLQCVLAHATYLLNLATTNDVLWKKSVDALVDELQRADQLKLAYLVIHPGSAGTSDEATALTQVALGIDTALCKLPKLRTQLCLEATAGQGNSIGHQFRQLGTILQKAKHGKKVGICLDTCHIFAAGYALAPRSDYQETIKEFDDEVGLERLCVWHLNDSVKGQGSRVDRHAHIGQGAIGLEGFRQIVNDERFDHLPMIMETPKGTNPDGIEWDAINLRSLKDLCHHET